MPCIGTNTILVTTYLSERLVHAYSTLPYYQTYLPDIT